MGKRVRYLTDAELEIMRMIWDRNSPMDSTMILNGLTEREWALSTLMGALKRLEVKGYVKRDDSGYRIMFSPNITESQYLLKVLSNMHDVHNMFKIKPDEIVTSLYESKLLSISQIKELQLCLDKIIINSQ